MGDGNRGVSGERRVVTALFCDVVGSTTLAEDMDPEDWGELASGAARTMGAVAARYGGSVTEFAGDAVLAVFGAPAAHEDDPFRAVSAGLEIVRAMRGSPDLNALQVRVGINTGLVVVSDIEAGAMRTVSALGDTMNVASRLQSLAEPGSVVISGATRRLLGSAVEAVPMGPMALKGRREPVDAYVVVSVDEEAHRSRGVSGLSSPMVGREAELRALTDLVAQARAGMGRAAVVLGEPGVGKSRLIAELREHVGADPAGAWAVGRCVAYDQERPLHLAATTVLALAGGASWSFDMMTIC